MKKIFMILLALAVLPACTVVGPTERAVRYNFGKVDNEVLTAGTHLWIPYFAGTKTLSVNVHALELQTSSGTKDQQEVTTKVVVNLQLDPAKVVEIVSTYGDEEAVIGQVIPQIQEAVNANVSKFSAEEILTKREQLKEAIDHVIKERAAKYSIIVHDISIKDLQYSPEYAKAIEQKQIAEQKSKQAEYDAIKANKEADGAINTARGQAESQKLLRANLTPEILQMRAIEKWNGAFPQYMGAGNLPFINMSMGHSNNSK